MKTLRVLERIVIVICLTVLLVHGARSATGHQPGLDPEDGIGATGVALLLRYAWAAAKE